MFLEDDLESDFSYQKLINIIEIQNIQENHKEAILFLRLLVSISNNHHRGSNFNTKITKILQFLNNFIKQTFTNLELFKICKSNKFIILFYIEQGIITVDKNIANIILYRSQKTNTKYHHFFYPEIKQFIENQKMIEIAQEIYEEEPNLFETNRKIGENESYICDLIRNDSIEEFISYINRSNVSVHEVIVPSIFETNSFLIKNEVTLIEYAAFYGSIQVFQYLKMNNCELKPSLWLFAIHSNNAEMIHLLEYSQVMPPDETYQICFIEAIKCHHNRIANYIKDVLLNENFNYKPVLQYYNYDQIPEEFEDQNIFYYLCRYDYLELVELYLKPKLKDLNERIDAKKKDIQMLFE